MKRLAAIWVCLGLLLAGCGFPSRAPQKYTATFLDLFDTVTTVVGFAESREAFAQTAQKLHDELLIYHQLLDIYNDYPGLANLKTVNDAAGEAPVQVDPRIVSFLLECKEYARLTQGRVNVAMGSVLALWHAAREDGLRDPENARLPEPEALAEAAAHTDPEKLLLDPQASTVCLADPQMRLDVGAVAKGWALERVCETAPEGLLISIGGNVRATGPKDAQGVPWVVGIQDPRDGSQNLHTLNITGGSVVTSGDYQRRYWVAGEAYHHIIHPQTLYPGTLWQSVTVVCPDSGLADALSTALFLLPLEEGLALAESLGAEAFWVDRENRRFQTPGFGALIRT